MFKRANKITALLVAAASVMSIVPAMAADSGRLQAKDGTVENAVAYKDGKYVYQGYKSDSDNESIYYNAGDKDKALDDVEDADLNKVYSDKYAFANDGKDQYLIDLTNGDVIDDQTPEDDADSAATKLKTKLKKTDRYGDVSVDSSNLNYKGNDNSVAALPGSKFGDVWYAYSINAGENTKADENLVNKKLFGFTDGSGNYIDACNLANIYAYSTAKGKMVKIDEFSKDLGDADDDTGLLATLVAQPVVLTQDKDSIYALVTVAITDTAAKAVVTGGTTGSAVELTGNPDHKVTTTRTYVQKISKKQGDQKDDAYLPKTVESYELGNADGKEFDCGDAKDAYGAIKDATGRDAKDLTQDDVVKEGKDGINKPLFTIIDGKLAVINATTENVKVTTINFKKDKVEFDKNATLPQYKDEKSYDIKDKVDIYMLEKADDNDVDIDIDSTDADNVANAYDIDVDGNVWLVAEGKIYEFSKDEFTKVYTTDSSLDQISVYDAKSLVAWQADGDIYTTVNEGTAETKSEGTATKGTDATTTAAVTAAKTGWAQLADGTWNLYDGTGTKVVNSWKNVGGVWYFLNGSGAMQTGWLNDNGTWYYLNASGAMLANTVVDGYKLNASGAWVK